jgi:hypothetical protein
MPLGTCVFLIDEGICGCKDFTKGNEMPIIPKRRCHYIDNRGIQCDTWFDAVDSRKLCPAHAEIITPGKNGNEESKVKYIDLVNDERKYCYHFLNGESQNQSQKLIFEFTDDAEGSVFEKLDNHIAFIEKVLEDMKARLHSARAVKSEKLDELSEEERKKLREHKIARATTEPQEKKASFKKDPIASLGKHGISADKAKMMLEIDDIDAYLAKFEEAKKNKKNL